ncbi:hypothetical protein C8Q76DRAFT_742429, partial [Earliella scabrosa]
MPKDSSILVDDLPKIPKPQVHITVLVPSQALKSLAYWMRLSGSIEQLKTYGQIVEDIAKLSDRYPDLCRGCSRAPGWKRFLRIANRECPLIMDYEESWPVNVIVREHSRYKWQRHAHLAGLANWSKHSVKK